MKAWQHFMRSFAAVSEQNIAVDSASAESVIFRTPESFCVVSLPRLGDILMILSSCVSVATL